MLIANQGLALGVSEEYAFPAITSASWASSPIILLTMVIAQKVNHGVTVGRVPLNPSELDARLKDVLRDYSVWEMYVCEIPETWVRNVPQTRIVM